MPDLNLDARVTIERLTSLVSAIALGIQLPAAETIPAHSLPGYLPAGTGAVTRARAALTRAFSVTWPHPDWGTIIPALAEAEQYLRDAGLMRKPELMQFVHLAARAASQRRGDDTRAYIDNIRGYLPAEDNEKEGP